MVNFPFEWWKPICNYRYLKKQTQMPSKRAQAKKNPIHKYGHTL